MPAALKYVDNNVQCNKWRAIFKQNLEAKNDGVSWKFNVDMLAADMKTQKPNSAVWQKHYGLWPGQALAIFAAHSRWVHLSTNTLPFYYVLPRLEAKFPSTNFNTFADGWESPDNHWLHESKDADLTWQLSQRINRFLRWHDGANVLLADKSEAGWYNIPDRGFDIEQNTRQGEFNPEHVHHNYLYSDVYEKSREARGAQGANSGQFLQKGKFADESQW